MHAVDFNQLLGKYSTALQVMTLNAKTTFAMALNLIVCLNNNLPYAVIFEARSPHRALHHSF